MNDEVVLRHFRQFLVGQNVPDDELATAGLAATAGSASTVAYYEDVNSTRFFSVRVATDESGCQDYEFVEFEGEEEEEKDEVVLEVAAEIAAACMDVSSLADDLVALSAPLSQATELAAQLVDEVRRRARSKDQRRLLRIATKFAVAGSRAHKLHGQTTLTVPIGPSVDLACRLIVIRQEAKA